jgi:hypothetical protein
MTASNVLLALIMYFWLGDRFNILLRFLFSLTLPFITPVIGLVFLDSRFYFGYIGMANYHNPTVQYLHPFALALFIIATQIFQPSKNKGWLTLLAAALMIISNLIKPNYTLCLLPAMLLVIIWVIYKKQNWDWKLAFFGFFIPAIITLIGEFLVSYILPNNIDTQIVFWPLVVESAFSQYLFIKFILSILFPLVTLLFFSRFILKQPEMLLAWFGLFFGVIQVYLFAETGNLLYDGNFRWGAQVALLVLFAATLRFIYINWENKKILTLRNKIISISSYLPHVISGIAYFVYCLVSTKYG